MQLSPAYQTWREETLQVGTQIGAQQERRVTLETLFQTQFGILDIQIESAIAAILQLPALEYTQFLRQLPNLTRQQLLNQYTR
jgi:hypothetical protein